MNEYPDSWQVYMACVMLEYLEPSDEINDWMNWAKTVNPCWFHVVGNARPIKDIFNHSFRAKQIESNYHYGMWLSLGRN